MEISIINSKELSDNIEGCKKMNPTGYTSMDECIKLIRESISEHIKENGFSCPDTDLSISVMEEYDRCYWFEPVELHKFYGRTVKSVYTVRYKGTSKG